MIFCRPGAQKALVPSDILSEVSLDSSGLGQVSGDLDTTSARPFCVHCDSVLGALAQMEEGSTLALLSVFSFSSCCFRVVKRASKYDTENSR